MNYIFDTYSCADLEVIKWQLKSNEVFPGGIVERCDFGFPRIILLSPGDNSMTSGGFRGESISNVIWLTCPYLNERIHALESDRNISRIADFINQDNHLYSVMQNAHAHFYFLRKFVYEELLSVPISDRWNELFMTGIGGIRQTAFIKCLHLHFSHFRMCRYNIVGLITFYLLHQKINCDEGMCNNAK